MVFMARYGVWSGVYVEVRYVEQTIAVGLWCLRRGTVAEAGVFCRRIVLTAMYDGGADVR